MAVSSPILGACVLPRKLYATSVRSLVTFQRSVGQNEVELDHKREVSDLSMSNKKVFIASLLGSTGYRSIQ